MSNLLKFNAKICYTAAGMLIHQRKVLLIKHKKLGIWLCPGGHIEGSELPHQAAEREFWEETGVKVMAVDPHQDVPTSQVAQYFPNPLQTNLHWVSEENYRTRMASTSPDKRVNSKLWPKGCEQHVGFLYLVEPVASLDFTENTEEVDGIAWFTREEIEQIDDSQLPFGVKQEIKAGFAASSN